jgi:hypothetical protein
MVWARIAMIGGIIGPALRADAKHWSQLMLHMVDELRRADADPEDAAMIEAAAAAADAAAPPEAAAAVAAQPEAPSADADIEMGETDA